MGKKDPRVDAYIAKAGPFAQPILKHIRTLVHRADPKIEETLKWRMPTFIHEGIVCGMAGFKQHCALGFWKSKLILDKQGRRVDEAMGNFGRISSLKDLPSDRELMGYIKKAVALNVDKVKVPGRERRKATPKRIPADFAAALKKNLKALKTFKALSPSHRNEYVVWIMEAKRAETRAKRIVTALSWLAQGKNMNWRYEARQT